MIYIWIRKLKIGLSVVSDTHGNFLWMTNGCLNNYRPEETAIIILGDAGFDFYLNKTDERKKQEVEARGYYIYWLRGNHEARPQDVKRYEKIFDENIHGIVYCDPRFPHLRAFLDYGFYDINGYSCLIIGGAYSVDKYWRLQRANLTEETNIPAKSGWFNNEQLSSDEMADCLQKVKMFAATGKCVDFVFTHTCPTKFQPIDMFLNFIDQSTVDNSMEEFLEEVSYAVGWTIWCFGHYHADRIERPKVEQYYNDMEEIDNIWNRWVEYDKTHELPWWLTKSPMFNS